MPCHDRCLLPAPSGELDRYRLAILRDSAQMGEQSNKIPSLDVLNFVMESLASGHAVSSGGPYLRGPTDYLVIVESFARVGWWLYDGRHVH